MVTTLGILQVLAREAVANSVPRGGKNARIHLNDQVLVR